MSAFRRPEANETARFHGPFYSQHDAVAVSNSRATVTKNTSDWRLPSGRTGISSPRTNAFLDGLRDSGMWREGRLRLNGSGDTTNLIQCPGLLLILYAATLMSSLRAEL